jgi:hypothetical protein
LRGSGEQDTSEYEALDMSGKDEALEGILEKLKLRRRLLLGPNTAVNFLPGGLQRLSTVTTSRDAASHSFITRP